MKSTPAPPHPAWLPRLQSTLGLPGPGLLLSVAGTVMVGRSVRELLREAGLEVIRLGPVKTAGELRRQWLHGLGGSVGRGWRQMVLDLPPDMAIWLDGFDLLPEALRATLPQLIAPKRTLILTFADWGLIPQDCADRLRWPAPSTLIPTLQEAAEIFASTDADRLGALYELTGGWLDVLKTLVCSPFTVGDPLPQSVAETLERILVRQLPTEMMELLSWLCLSPRWPEALQRWLLDERGWEHDMRSPFFALLRAGLIIRNGEREVGVASPLLAVWLQGRSRILDPDDLRRRHLLLGRQLLKGANGHPHQGLMSLIAAEAPIEALNALLGDLWSLIGALDLGPVMAAVGERKGPGWQALGYGLKSRRVGKTEAVLHLRAILSLEARGALPGLDLNLITVRLASLLFQLNRVHDAWVSMVHIESRVEPSPRLLFLKGALAIHQGEQAPGIRALERALRLVAGRDRPLEREILSALGAVKVRQGALREATHIYQRAMVDLSPSTDLRVFGALSLNLGMVLLLQGAFAPSHSHLGEAQRAKSQAEQTTGVANTLAARALLSFAQGQRAEAGALNAQARRLAEDSGSAELLVEIELQASRLAQVEGDWAQSRASLERAEAALAPGQDVLLGAMVSERWAEVAAYRGDLGVAVPALRRARRIAAQEGARYLLVRIDLLWAAILHSEGKERLVIHVLMRVRRVMGQERYVFWFRDPIEAVLGFGERWGSSPIRALCVHLLGGEPSRHAPSAPDRLSSPDAGRRIWCIDRGGGQWITQGALKALRQRQPTIALVLDMDSQTLALAGQGAQSLAGHPVTLELLLRFLRNPDRLFTSTDLLQHVWQDRRQQESSKVRLRVAISRLRGRLRPVGGGILSDRDGGQRGYCLDPALDFLLIES